jgi:hypothetical protein
VPCTSSSPSFFNYNYATSASAVHYDHLLYIRPENTKFSTPQWILLGILAHLQATQNSRASPRVLNDEAEEVEGVEEEHLVELMATRSIMAIADEAGAILNLGVGAEEVIGKVPTTVEDRRQKKAKRP